MTDDNKTKKNGNRKTIAAGLAGAAIGVAAAVALSNKNTRKKIGKTVEDARQRGIKLVMRLRKSANETKKDVAQKTKDVKKAAEKAVEEIKK